jgi:fatty acid desaturase
MHHTENNTAYDISETESYVRNSWLEYLRYYTTFLFGMLVYPIYYAIHIRRYELAVIHTTAISAWFFIFSLLWKINPVGTWWVLGFPAVLMTILLSFGNWSQHIFVDPDRPTKNHALTYNCMNHFDNQRLFNDGYHVQHHINGPLHWSKLPEYFMSNLDSFALNDGILFQGVHFFDVGVMVMFGQWDKLCSHYVYVDGGKDYSKEELIKMFKHRLNPVQKKK